MWKKETKHKRRRRDRALHIDCLEDRKLLATTTETFTGPSLTSLIQQANAGEDTSKATINTMLTALQNQLTSGPLADLNAGTVDGNGFISEAQSLEASYAQNVDQQLSPAFPNIDTILKLQGQRVVAGLVSLNQQSTEGLITSTDLATQAQTAIQALTGGPIISLGTPVSAYVTTTQTFESDLKALATNLTSTSPIADPGLTFLAEAEAYRADMHAGLQVTHPNISNSMDQAVNTLESSVGAVDLTSATAPAQLTAAFTAFDTAMLDKTGLFGPQGPVVKADAKYGYVPHNLTVQRTATTLTASGTASNGTATLTATLTSATGAAIANATVNLTLDGAFAGSALTDSSGVATLSNVPSTDATGTVTGAIVATFPGTLQNKSSQATGDLVVSQSSTTTTAASATATHSASNQNVALSATVTSPGGTVGEGTETFTLLQGTTVIGTAVTVNVSAGAAAATYVLPGGTAAGTYTIKAVYNGTANFATSTDTSHSLTVS
jgi:hypothetical protein